MDSFVSFYLFRATVRFAICIVYYRVCYLTAILHFYHIYMITLFAFGTQEAWVAYHADFIAKPLDYNHNV